VSGTPVGRRPGLFALVAIFHGVLASAFAIGVVVFVELFALRGFRTGVLELVGLSFVLTFMLLVVVVFTAQTVNAVTLLGRRGDVVGSYDLATRFVKVLPLATTRWSRFWVGVQVKPWQHPRLLGVSFLLVTALFSFVLLTSPVAVGITVAVCLAAAVALVIWERR
jgi:hypothetical protein